MLQLSIRLGMLYPMLRLDGHFHAQQKAWKYETKFNQSHNGHKKQLHDFFHFSLKQLSHLLNSVTHGPLKTQAINAMCKICMQAFSLHCSLQ